MPVAKETPTIQEEVVTEKPKNSIDDLMAAPDAQPEKQFIVLYGVGKIARHQLHWIDTTRFEGGVALHVAESTIKAWRKSPNGRQLVLQLLPDMPDVNVDAKGHIPDEAYAVIARKAGVSTETPEKTAAILQSADIDALYHELGDDAAYRLWEQLGKRVKRRPRNA